MKVELVDFVDLEAKVRTLGCTMPTGVTVLPINLEQADSAEDLCYESTHLELRKQLRDSGILGTSLEGSEDKAVRVRLRESALSEWVAPVMFLAESVLADLVARDLFLGVVSNWLYEVFKRTAGREPSESEGFDFKMVVLDVSSGKWKYASLTAHLDKGKPSKELMQAARLLWTKGPGKHA